MGLHIPQEILSALSNAIGNEQLFIDLIRNAIAAGHVSRARAGNFIVAYYQRREKLARKLSQAARHSTRHIKEIPNDTH